MAMDALDWLVVDDRQAHSIEVTAPASRSRQATLGLTPQEFWGAAATRIAAIRSCEGPPLLK
jgi:phage gp46-like protein